MALDKLVIKGAREHNLKNIDLEIPRDKLIVFTGLSGSGKSSLAFDTIYADGQRRYMESLSSYARQFLGQMEKPDVDSIEGLSPAISIDQKTTSKNPRSTVGTVTEIYDYLRLLYARIGIPHCPICGRPIEQQAVDQMVDRIMEIPEGTRIQILSPKVRGKKGQHIKELDSARRSGYVRARIDGNLYDLAEEITLDKNKKHTIEIIVDRLVVKKEMESRLADSLETALDLSGGLVMVDAGEIGEFTFSQNYCCPEHSEISIEELTPRMFSFNAPYGACEKCTGLGTFLKVDPDLVIPNKSLTIREGAIRASGWYYAEGGIAQMYYEGLAEHYGFSLDVPVAELPPKAVQILLYGSNGEKIMVRRETDSMKNAYYTEFEGIVNNLERRFRETNSNWMRDEITTWMNSVECPACHGERLNKIVLAVTVGGVNISQFCKMSVVQALDFLNNLSLNHKEQMIAASIIKEVRERLGFLCNVGLDYLTLSRSAGTLSGGESQRIRLATQIGSSL
ncbi:MAG: excinuclease ABC subunit UvrA, partial [Oscillospiraceae bacterium]|nr:excinuclease ABC subunit UvrA [Oscillospiraceae bacterium]